MNDFVKITGRLGDDVSIYVTKNTEWHIEQQEKRFDTMDFAPASAEDVEELAHIYG